MSTYDIAKFYHSKFNAKPEVIMQSPGRINIIGEHTDYNLGYVLPAAINHYMFIGVSSNGSNQVNLHSIDYQQDESISLDKVERTENGWLNLISGVVNQLKERIGGFDLAFGGNIPEGAGVSSSAALCCGVASALSELYGLGLEKWEIAKIAQKSEHEFALVKCGIMDQFACLFGLKDHVLLLNCESYEYEESKVDIAGYKFLLVNSNVKHSLGDSAYNTRRDESTRALEQVKKKYPEVKTYQDVTSAMLHEMTDELEEVLWKRAFHVVSENERVFEMKDSLKSKDQQKVGELLSQGHVSLKDNFEVTCAETDYLVASLENQASVLGARQVGGGFGGCILALVQDTDLDQLLAPIREAYKTKFDLELDNIPVQLSQGCHRI
ncbi:MAG: galactokinase [Bacteroidota bacterium]